MKETRKFLRYLMPGLTFASLLLAALFLSNHAFLKNIFLGKVNLGIVIASFLMSGALGYIFNVIYFTIYWSFRGYFAIDHTQTIISLSEKDYLEILDCKGAEYPPKDLQKIDGWNIVTIYCHSRMKKSKELDAASGKIDLLANLTHGLGASLVAVFISLITWLYIHFIFLYHKDLTHSDCGILFIYSIFFILSLFNYLFTRTQFQAFVNSVFAGEVIREFSTKNIGRPAKVKLKLIYEK